MNTLNRHKFKLNALLCAGIIGGITFSSFNTHASEVEDSQLFEPNIYNTEFFAQYLPQNALDMINRLPGFSFDKGSSDRGFGGNAGNVLIDGARPTSKSGGLQASLARIPADQVVRIEILRGGNSAGETAGQSLVANVIKAKGSTSGTWDVTTEGNVGEQFLPQFRASLTTQLGDWQTSFNTIVARWASHRSADIQNYDANQTITTSEKEGYIESQRWATLAGEGSTEFAGGKLSVNGFVNRFSWLRDSEQTVFSEFEQALTSNNRMLNQDNSGTSFELGVDWVKSYDDWKLRMIGLGLLQDRIANNNFKIFSDDTFNFGRHDYQDSRKTEVVSRMTLARINASKFKPEFGFEVANNRLDSQLEQFQNGVLQAAQDNDKVAVEEMRGEAFANFVYQASDALTLEGGITAEYSQIEVDSLNSQKQDFSFFKPRISSTYKLSPQSQLSVELARKVGQLNFNDFATSNEAFDGITNTGNSDLMPDKTTELAANYDWSFSERGSVKVNVFHQWRKDILEQVLIGEDVSGTPAYGLGNAGSAKFWGINTDINLPLDFLLSNALLEVSHSYQGSDFYDSIINENRNINNYVPKELEVNFRQDLVDHGLAWGAGYSAATLNRSFRVNEVQTFEQAQKFWFFIESSQFFGVKTYLELNSTQEQTRARYFYQGDRNGVLNGNQLANRELNPVIVLKFSGTF